MTPHLMLYQKKAKLIVGGLGIAAFVVGLFIMLMGGPNPESIFRPFRSPMIFYPIIVGGLVFFAYLAWFAFNSLRHPKPRVVLSDSGVVVDGFSGRFSARWDEFSGYAVQEQSTYVLAMKDAQVFVARQTAGRPQQTARALTERFGSPFLIETAVLDTDPDAVLRVLASRLPVASP